MTDKKPAAGAETPSALTQAEIDEAARTAAKEKARQLRTGESPL